MSRVVTALGSLCPFLPRLKTRKWYFAPRDAVSHRYDVLLASMRLANGTHWPTVRYCMAYHRTGTALASPDDQVMLIPSRCCWAVTPSGDDGWSSEESAVSRDYIYIYIYIYIYNQLSIKMVRVRRIIFALADPMVFLLAYSSKNN